MITEHRFTTGEVTINYLNAGTPHGTPLLLLHGISMWRKTWLPIIPHLGKTYRIIAPDLRGHGTSTHVPGGYSTRDYARDIVRLLSDHIHQPAILFGHSLGAMVASEIAADERDLVRAIILEDPPLFHYRASINDTPWARLFRPMYAFARMGDEMAPIETAVARRMPHAEARVIKSYAGRFAALDPDTLRFALEDRMDYDMRSVMPRITCPTLLIQADPQLGAALDDEDAALARDLLPNVRSTA